VQWPGHCDEVTVLRGTLFGPLRAYPEPETIMIRSALFLVLALVMFFVWIAGGLMMKVPGGAIHLALALALLFFIVHLFRSRHSV
jgi:hypothetical protein